MLIHCRDGVHLTTQGYSVLFDAFSELIKTKFKGRGLDFTDFDDLPFRAPWSVNLMADVDRI